MTIGRRLFFLDNLRTFLIFLVVLFHAGVVYDRSGMGATWWIVIDPGTSDVPGLANLMLDIFIMPTIFLVAGYFTRPSLERKGDWPFLAARFRRLMVPWLVAALTLIPLYKMIFLYSRDLPQEDWTTYFHFTNGIFSMSWLWFLPALFLFSCLYVPLSKLSIPPSWLTLNRAVVAVFVAGMSYTLAIGTLGWYGWTKTPLIDFQNEKLGPYFLVFLLGALCHRLRVFDSDEKNVKLYIGVLATAWLPMNLYAIVLINYFLHPGQYLVSEIVDRLLLWTGYHLSLLSLLYCAMATFRYYFNRQSRLGRELGKLSYGVYIIHVIVLGAIALALRETGLPGLGKYAALALGTWSASNLIAYGYAGAIRGFGWRS